MQDNQISHVFRNFQSANDTNRRNAEDERKWIEMVPQSQQVQWKSSLRKNISGMAEW